MNRFPAWMRVWLIYALIQGLIWLKWPLEMLTIILWLVLFSTLFILIGLAENAKRRTEEWKEEAFLTLQVCRVVQGGGTSMVVFGLLTLIFTQGFLPDYPWGTILVTIAGVVVFFIAQWVIKGITIPTIPRVPD